MAIRYEANPPKILPGVDRDKAVAAFMDRIMEVSQRCDAIHLTENVLGHHRVSPIEVGRMIKKEIPDIPITASLRVRDKNREMISEIVDECVSIGFAGVLVLMGDPSRTRTGDSGEIPSDTVRRLRNDGVDKKIDLYLSIPSNPDPSKIVKKIEAHPRGFMTQVVHNLGQVQNLVNVLDGFSVIPILLYPSAKNAGSAKFLNLDLGSYGRRFDEFVREVHDTTGDVLITSPSDFGGLSEFLKEFRP